MVEFSMPDHVCPQCGLAFYHRKGARKFCSVACYRKWQRRYPNKTTFQPGQDPGNRMRVGSVRIRTRHKRGGVRRAWVKVAEPNIWRSRAVVEYEVAHGRIPKGMVVHHKNGDKLDDRPENLEVLSRADHLRTHRPTIEKQRIAALRSRQDQ